MDRAALAASIADTIMDGRRHPRGMLGILEDGERAAGRGIIALGSEEPFVFSSADFVGAVLSLKDGEVRIVIIQAHRERTGAFSRLVRAIQGAGLHPVVVEPVGAIMPAILKRWQWRKRVIGKGWESVTEWRPGPASTPPRIGASVGGGAE